MPDGVTSSKLAVEMIRSSRKNRVTVCVVAAHPMVLTQLQRVLNAAPLYVDDQRLAVVGAENSPLSKASVYILDAASCPDGPVARAAYLLQQEPGANVLVLG